MLTMAFTTYNEVRSTGSHQGSSLFKQPTNKQNRMRIFQSGKTKALLTLLLSLSILIQKEMSQTPVLTISSDPTTPGFTFYNDTRTLTVSSMSTANVHDVIGYLNAWPTDHCRIV